MNSEVLRGSSIGLAIRDRIGDADEATPGDVAEGSIRVEFATPKPSWRDATVLTVALWLFVLIMYLPLIISRHGSDGWDSIALDASTILFSMLLGLGLFGLFRLTMGWPVGHRAVTLGAGVFAATVVQMTFDLLFQGWVGQHLVAAWQSLAADFGRVAASGYNYVCVFGVNLALFHLTFARRVEASHDRQLTEARWEAQKAQLTALRYQLNPHFLFNTLNAISAMIVTGRNADAEAMTDKLSSFLRASLASDPTELVPLDAELALIEEYLEIESIRFGDRLSIEVPVSAEAGAVLVPSFLIQPLVENAIKYGVAPTPRPVTIRIAARIDGSELVLSVEDDGAGAPGSPKPKGAGVGLGNVRRRLEAIYGGGASLTAAPLAPGYCVTVRLPIEAPRAIRAGMLDRAALQA